MTDGHVAVFMTAASMDEAASIAKKAVEERLAACCNIISGVRSIYAWKGSIHDSAEVLCVFKTRSSLFEPLRQRIKELHSYEVPEIVAVEIKAGLAEYLAWIDASTVVR